MSGRRPAQERVKAINNALKRRGLVTWFDCNEDSPHRMQGQMDATMARAIKNTGCVVAVITDLYRRKVNGIDQRDNCWKEFNFACRKIGPQGIVPVVAEEVMKRDDWDDMLEFNLGGKLYIDATGTTDGPGWEKTMDELSRAVRQVLIESKRSITVDVSNSVKSQSALAEVSNDSLVVPVNAEADVDDSETCWRDVDPSLESRRWFW